MRIRMLSTAFALAALATMAIAPISHAAPITRLVVAFPTGGPADTLARAISRQLELELKQTVVIDNRPGANGAIAASVVAKAPTDGSVLFLTSAGAIVINPSLYASLPYNPQKDLTPISLVVNTPECRSPPPSGCWCSSSSAAGATSCSASRPTARSPRGLPVFLFLLLFGLSMDYHVPHPQPHPRGGRRRHLSTRV